MDCAEFDRNIDLYIDRMLSTSDMDSAASHTKACRGCNESVTSYQHARALLTTAVADRVTAVDVSGMWEAIEASLGSGVGHQGAHRTHWYHLVADRAATLAERARALASGSFTPARAGMWAAAAAAVALMVTMWSSGTEPARVAASRKIESKPVRIDSMEVAAGHTVSTWVRPRTNTRVIWIGDGDGFSVENASLSR